MSSKDKDKQNVKIYIYFNNKDVLHNMYNNPNVMWVHTSPGDYFDIKDIFRANNRVPL